MPDPSPTSYSSEEGVVAGYSGQFTLGDYLPVNCETHYVSRHRTHNFLLLVRRATSKATETVQGTLVPC